MNKVEIEPFTYVNGFKRFLEAEGFPIAAGSARQMLETTTPETLRQCWDQYSKGKFELDPHIHRSF